MESESWNSEVIRIKRFFYIHILDNNTNVTRTLVGPIVYTRKEHETCLFKPRPCVSVPARSYVIVKNPVLKDKAGSPVVDSSGQVQVRMGDREIRFETDPFPLHPYEELDEIEGQTVFKLRVIPVGKGLHLRCVRDFENSAGKKIVAGSEWIEEGPKTYTPHVAVTVVQELSSLIIRPNAALRLAARIDFQDRNGVARVAGESWLIRKTGTYLPAVEEVVEEMVEGVVLTDRKAVHVRALDTFTDVFGKKRKTGDTWLVTHKDTSVFIPDVHESVVKHLEVVSLNPRQFCIVENPVDNQGHNHYGEREVRRGERSFFLQPGEQLVEGVRDVIAVGKDEALLLKSLSDYKDGKTLRPPGSVWMLHGPAEYVPVNGVELVETRKLIALDKNEGIYVMNTITGEVRAVIGKPYMPTENEVLWEKHLSREVEELLMCPGGSRKVGQLCGNVSNNREKHRIVRFNVQHNAAVQIYDYIKKQQRIVLGPGLVILGPHEEFTVLSLSGGKPKVPNAVQSLQLFLGPRFSSDTVIVETSDHARLCLRLSYNWHFDIKRDKEGIQQKSFSVPDFIGDCCKTIASRVRGAVAAVDFDSFHRNSAKIIREAVFGCEKGEVRKELRFSANDFVVTNIDVQSAEPTDEKTRDSLQKSVQLAIEITTKSQEATARHGNELKDQEAKGKLERQKLLDKTEVEKAKTTWLKLQAESEAVQASGQSVAEAKAKAEALLIEVNSELKQAELRAKAYLISAEAELKKLKQRQSIELMYTKRQNEMEIEKAKHIAEAEAVKVKRMVDAVGRDTLVAIARAGPEMQAKLLGGLGLKGYLITDGNSPVNLFSTAERMVSSNK